MRYLIIKFSNFKLFRFILFVPLLMIFNFPSLYSQVEYVDAENPVYNFLERMESQQLISDYNSFELPKTRKQISGYLMQAVSNTKFLDKIDVRILNDLKSEFELEISGTVTNSQIDFFSDEYGLFSQKEKYLYFVVDTSAQVNLFVNVNLGFEQILTHSDITNLDNSAKIFSFGGEFRGTFLEKFGFHYKGSFGSITGDKKAALINKKLQYNFRFNDLSSTSFDRTEDAYITADFNLLRLKFGRDRVKIGYGEIKPIFGDNAVIFDYLGMRMKYKAFEYTYLHGRILGNTSFISNSTSGFEKIVVDKYIGYHHLSINLSDVFIFGIGEVIIYGDRPLDLSYLNPFIIYKFVQNDNKDRDNSLLFFDFANKSIKGLKIYSTFLIDDLDFSKLGTSFWGNQFLLNVGIISTNLYRSVPIDFQFEYMVVDPFVYTHKFERNSFTNDGRSLASFVPPNSELFFSKINYRFTNRLSASLRFMYMVHGANPLNSDGTVKVNVGGNVLLGHRTFDPITVPLLSGDREYTRELSISIIYEPIKNYFAELNINLRNGRLQNFVNNKTIESFLTINFKL